ncbi:uncharacterized protein LOC132056686 isoform X3 [Lycium ferocissimum]|uniref:uncharacterized protein LOC132056686 isoform X3 n=1 Tax=Lycium ferocissimum TaxID=112874 RepID=UPI002815645F|nr:uncharacterized protein LOC132056686 isoform X3 [Lycium ferocissimum]
MNQPFEKTNINMMPLLFSSSSHLSFFLFYVIIMIYFPKHPCVARKSLANKAVEELYFSTDSSRVENGSKGIANLQQANKSVEDFHKEKNDNKGTEIIGSESSLSSLPHARLHKAAKIKGARWSTTHDIHVASQTGNKSLYRDIIEMDYDPPHRKSPIHN